jgi:glycosyltransferase involved in cell wall biosynthesis
LDYLLYNIPVAIDMRRNKVSICHCNDFDTLPAGALLKLVTCGRAKVVYDSHEDYPLFVEEGYGRLFGRIIGIAESLLTRCFVDVVITVTETIKSRFDKKGIKSEVIFNCQDLLSGNAAGGSPVVEKKDNEFWVTYQGYIARTRGYEQLVEAADILVNERRIPGLKFVIIGNSAPDVSYVTSIEKLIAEKKLEGSFIFTGFVIYEDMMQILKRADVGVILYQPGPNNSGVLPNKLFENLAAGIPTVASNFAEMGRIITEEKCGMLVNPAQPEEIANALEYVYRHGDDKLEKGRNALKAAQQKYNFAKQADKLLKIYKEIS